jgi:hypothetical protein
MSPLLEQFRDFFVSLRLTVVLLILSLVLIFVATLDQVNLGIWVVQEKYFRSFVVLWQLPGLGIPVPVFPGGYFLGGLLIINLIAAHVYRFELSWKKSGIQIAHAGLILLLIGELLTGLLQKESSMRLDEGETKQYSESFHANELALLDKTPPDYDEVVAVPEAVLADQGTVQHPKLPFQLRIKGYYPNANLHMRDAHNHGGAPAATHGVARTVAMTPLPITYKPNERNMPGAVVEIATPGGPIGSWIVSPLVAVPQIFTHEGRTWEIALRFKRYYNPFTITLLNFSHDRYAGTEIPKNFSSRVRVRSDDGNDDHEVLIYMNNPLRHGGLTFYQAGFEKGDRTSILQVVRNPGWLIPYIACVMMGLGLVVQFSVSLRGFFNRRPAP